MPGRRFILAPALELDELAEYHRDIEASLRLYFSPSAPAFAERFAGRSSQEVKEKLTLRLDESDVRSTFAALTSLEAPFPNRFRLSMLATEEGSPVGLFSRGGEEPKRKGSLG